MGAKKPRNIPPGLRARQYLLDHPHDSNQEVANAVKCGLRTVGYARKELIDQGIVNPSYFERSLRTQALKLATRQQKLPPPPSITNPDTDPDATQIVEQVVGKKTGNLTTEESLAMLTQFARVAQKEKNFALAKDAVIAHDRIAKGSTVSQLGPPPPQKDEDKATRTTNILDVVGPTIAALAIVKAFPIEEDRKLFEEEFARQSVTHPPHKEPRALDLAGESSHDQTPKDKESPQMDQGHAEDSLNSSPRIPLNETNEELGGHREKEEGL